MAIPVSNPPPRYEPTGQRPQGESGNGGPSGGGPPELPPGPEFGAPPRQPSGQQRGCFIALGVLGALGCVASLAIVVSCGSCFREASAFTVDDIAGEYRLVAEREGELAADDPDLRALSQLAHEGRVSWIALGVLSNRFQEARADGVTSAEELHHGMELVHDIVVGNGSIDPERYPDAR
jgi:hypothetical protein